MRSFIDEPPLNLALKNIVETYLKQKSESETMNKTESCCSLHGEKLLVFCQDDREPLCVVCLTSKKHKNHQICPVEEAALDLKEELKTALRPMKEKLEKFTSVNQQCEKKAHYIRSQAQHTERQVKAEFEKLHQFLRDEEEARLAVLREEEEQKSWPLKERIEYMTRQAFILSDKITDIEKAMHTEDISFLKSYRYIKERAQCTLQDPELLSEALIDVAKHLGNLKYRVWEKMLETVQYNPVTLDPNTAAYTLSLSADLSSVRFNGPPDQQLLDNPERFDPYGCVLGSEGFISGKHSWEVEVGNKPDWDVGVVNESINRKGEITVSPEGGFWVLMLRNGDKYWASGVTVLTLEKKPQRIRVQLDYDSGKVSFYNPTDMSHIHTFKHKFTDKIFPYFSPCSNTDGRNPEALQVCPVKVSVTVTSSL